MSTDNKKRVVIIGGGYAGVSLMHKLKNNDNCEITLIDKSQKHLLQTHIHKYLSGHYNKEDITFNHEKYCKENNIDFLCDEVCNINYKENYVLTRENKLVHYDYLVVATGSISIFPRQIENIIEYTKDIKNIDNLDFYRDKFFKLLDSEPQNRNIVVVGGGVSGLQIACEYAQKIKDKNLKSSQIKVTLVEGMDTVLPGMNPYLIKKSTQRCKDLGIEIVTNLFASKINADSIELSNKQEIQYDMLLFVIGAIGNDIQNNDDRVQVNQRHQLIVDKYYRVKPYDNVFAIGDIVQAMDIKTESFQAPTAQAARMQAELTAKNILNDMDDKKLIQNNISNKGILIDLGGSSCAIGRLFNINLWGKPALWFKKLIYSLHTQKFN